MSLITCLQPRARSVPQWIFAGLVAFVAAGAIAPAAAQVQDPSAKVFQPATVPSFWDPRRRPERPDMSRINLVRFITEVDYPPFNYAGADGNPAGFNVDL